MSIRDPATTADFCVGKGGYRVEGQHGATVAQVRLCHSEVLLQGRALGIENPKHCQQLSRQVPYSFGGACVGRFGGYDPEVRTPSCAPHTTLPMLVRPNYSWSDLPYDQTTLCAN